MAFDSQIESVRVEKIDLNMECYFDMLTGKGIQINEVESFDKKNEKIYNGLQSEFFGTDQGDENAFVERYSCKCHKYIGKALQGVICDSCGTPVEYHDIDLTKTGWIILNKFYVLTPIHCAKMIDALGSIEGESVLSKILNVDYENDGVTVKYSDKDLAILKKHPFIRKGCIWLHDHIDEVLDFYAKKKPAKQKLFDELKSDTNIMWTHAIPVFSALLRTEVPSPKGSKSFKMKINTTYKTLIRLANYINKKSEEELTRDDLISIDKQLATMHDEIMGIFNQTYKDLTGKRGIVLGKVEGGRYNFSARNIIVCSSGELRANEVKLGYITFMELYRYEIMNFYTKLHKCSYIESQNTWKQGLTHFNQELYNIMVYMTNDEECKKYLNIIISRNPCINYGSFLVVRVAAVKPDFNDKTMTVPSAFIRSMGADFDGDVLNIFRIFSTYFYKKFAKNLDPRYNLYVNRINGNVNRDSMPFKDESIGFWAFNNT